MDIQLQSTPGPLASAITSAVDSLGGDVPNGGTTADTVLTLSGTGTQHTVVYIFDNQTLLRTASVISLGTWGFTATVELGRHAFTVRDALGGGDSAEWVINVAEAELELKPPTVVQAPDGTLNPMDAISGATVVVSYDDMQPTDTIGLSWNGLDNLVSTQPGNAIGSVTFTVPASAVAAVIGKTIPVLYAVVRNGFGKPSWELPLTVETLAESVLEAPRILQASEDGSLDVGALTGDADLRVKPWPFIEAGQLISLRFEGTKADGTAYNWAHPAWQDLPIGSTGEPSTKVTLGNLKELKDDSKLRLIFEVSFDGGRTRIRFPVRSYSVHIEVVVAENLDAIPSQSIVVGRPLDTPRIIVALVTGGAARVIPVTNYSPPTGVTIPGQRERQILEISGCTLNIHLKRPAKGVSFYYSWVNLTSNYVEFLNADGVSLDRQFLTVNLYDASLCEFSVVSSERIHDLLISVAVGDVIAVDCFRFIFSKV